MISRHVHPMHAQNKPLFEEKHTDITYPNFQHQFFERGRSFLRNRFVSDRIESQECVEFQVPQQQSTRDITSAMYYKRHIGEFWEQLPIRQPYHSRSNKSTGTSDWPRSVQNGKTRSPSFPTSNENPPSSIWLVVSASVKIRKIGA